MGPRSITKSATIKRSKSTYPNVETWLFWLSLAAVMLVPLSFSTLVYRTFALPKYSVLVSLASAMLPAIGWVLWNAAKEKHYWDNKSATRHSFLVAGYLIPLGLSTVFGVAPVANLLGSFENKMGLITLLCFVLCFFGLIFGIQASRERLLQSVWAISFVGCLIALYAFFQFFGRDPFLPISAYTYNSGDQQVVRTVGTLGHPDYLGNFLLYTTPLTAGLAIASRDTARRFAVGAVSLSIAAILFSGTRGAWIGLLSAAASFLMFELFSHRKTGINWRSVLKALAIAIIIVAFAVWILSFANASHDLISRAKLFFSSSDEGGGRTLLWQDSLKMIRDFPVIGCGPEGFRRAFLQYRSLELARFAPDINNESSHSAYIDTSISFGLVGCIWYLAIIGATLAHAWKARQKTSDPRLRLIISGLLSSFAGVLVHNVFIFDQISTGLYFFAYLALSFSVTRVVSRETKASELEQEFRKIPRRGSLVISVSCIVLLAATATYFTTEALRDRAIGKAFAAAEHGEFGVVREQARVATKGFDPAGQYDFAAARALTRCAEELGSSINGQSESSNLRRSARQEAIQLAALHAGRYPDRSLTPDSSFSLLAYIYYLDHNNTMLKEYSEQAVRIDPYSANARWLLAEALLSAGENAAAIREAKFSAGIDSSSDRPGKIIERAQGEVVTRRLKVEKAIENARGMIEKGKLDRAEAVLRRAAGRTGAPCPECHRLLATILEARSNYHGAIEEWLIFKTQSPDPNSVLEAGSNIERLRQKTTLR